MKQLTIKETAAWFGSRDRFLFITHHRPDGDTLCSAAALAVALREQGKTAWLMPNPETSKKYIEFVEDLFAPEGYEPEHLVTVDIATESLFPQGAEELAGKIDMCIDHHPSNTHFAAQECIDHTRASCGEVVLAILKEMAHPLSAEVAKLLYVAVSTDTGCFVYSNTTSETLIAAAEIIAAGAPNGALNKKLFRTRSKHRIWLESMMIAGMEFYRDGAVAIASITKKMQDQIGNSEEIMDDIASVPGTIEGVIVGITIRELGEDKCKVSVRTMPQVSASDICAKFGGGGHAMAAGCTIGSSVGSARRLLAKAVDEVWKPVEEWK